MIWLLLACAQPPAPCVGFAGDLALGRGLGERLLRGPPPPALLDPHTAWIANLEGALAPQPGAPCRAPEGLCLGFTPADLPALDRLPLAALSLANNHAADHGAEGLEATIAALQARGLRPLTEAEGPAFLDLPGLRLGLVVLDLSRRGPGTQVQVERALLQLRRARAEAELVAILPHWGVEELAGLGPEQEALADRFVEWGADLVVGSGAHVVQALDCGEDQLRAYGLGNLLFDDPPGSVRGGLALRCCAADGRMSCQGQPSRSEGRWPGADPRQPAQACSLALRPPPDLRWKAHRAWPDFRSVEPFPPEGDGAFLALWEQPSTFDDAVALRPLVFRVSDGRAVDLWRGTSLSRPLVGARMVEGPDGPLLCATERGDRFLAPDPETSARQEVAYRWNGFGFTGVGPCPDPRAEPGAQGPLRDP